MIAAARFIANVISRARPEDTQAHAMARGRKIARKLIADIRAGATPPDLLMAVAGEVGRRDPMALRGLLRQVSEELRG